MKKSVLFQTKIHHRHNKVTSKSLFLIDPQVLQVKQVLQVHIGLLDWPHLALRPLGSRLSNGMCLFRKNFKVATKKKLFFSKMNKKWKPRQRNLCPKLFWTKKRSFLTFVFVSFHLSHLGHIHRNGKNLYFKENGGMRAA